MDCLGVLGHSPYRVNTGQISSLETVGIVWFMLGLHVFVHPMLIGLKPSKEKRFEHLVSCRDNEATRSAGFARPEDC